MSEPDEVAAARRVLRDYQRVRDQERQAEEERLRVAYVESVVGGMFEVDESGYGYSGDVGFTVSFTARLVSADWLEGTQVWDNGVTTTGVTIFAVDRLPEPPVTEHPVTKASEGAS